jgi:hypothetical protein
LGYHIGTSQIYVYYYLRDIRSLNASCNANAPLTEANYDFKASVALRLPTTAKHMTGEMIYETDMNFAIDIFSCSSAPLTSASAVNLVADGPVGNNINTNQSTGSSLTQFVLETTRHITPILKL